VGELGDGALREHGCEVFEVEQRADACGDLVVRSGRRGAGEVALCDPLVGSVEHVRKREPTHEERAAQVHRDDPVEHRRVEGLGPVELPDAGDVAHDVETAELKMGAFNWRGYSNPDLDKLLQQAATELDEGKRRALLEDAGLRWRSRARLRDGMPNAKMHG